MGSFFLADLKIQLIRRKHHIQVHTGKPQEAVGFPLKERTQKVWRRRNYTRPLSAPSRQFQSFLCNEIKWISLSTEAYVQYYEKAHCQWLTELCTLHVVCSDLLFFSFSDHFLSGVHFVGPSVNFTHFLLLFQTKFCTKHYWVNGIH